MKKREIATNLKEKGLRSTKFRRNILSILSKTKKPYTIEEIKKEFKKRSTAPHLTTLYRELKRLEESEILNVCGVHGKKEYSMKERIPIAHCTECNATTKLSYHEVSDIKIMQGILKKKVGFQIFPTGHIHGLCTNCRKAA